MFVKEVKVFSNAPILHDKAHRFQERYREFMAVFCQWTFLRALKRCGLSVSPILPPGALTIFCLACPQPTINMSPGWKDVPEDHRSVSLSQGCLFTHFSDFSMRYTTVSMEISS